MATPLFGHLTHLLTFKESTDSYQVLLQAAQKIISCHQRSEVVTTFVAEDLWLRDRKLGVFGLPHLSEKEIGCLPWPQAQYEQQTMQLIRSFLFHAVSCGDMYRAPLAGSHCQENGFAFTSPVRPQKF